MKPSDMVNELNKIKGKLREHINVINRIMKDLDKMEKKNED